jgi:integrase
MFAKYQLVKHSKSINLMSTNLKLLLDERTKSMRKDGTFPIILRLTHLRRVANIQMGFAVKPTEWDTDKEIIKGACKRFSNVTRTNNYLIKKKSKANDIITKLMDEETINTYTCTELKNLIKNELVGESGSQAKSDEIVIAKIIDVLLAKKHIKGYSTYSEGNIANKPILLLPAVAMYIDYLNNIGVEPHKRKTRTKNLIQTYERYLSRYLKYLLDIGVSLKTLRVDQIKSDYVGKLYNHLDEINVTPSVFNHYFKTMKAFYNFLLENDYNVRNPFAKIRLKYLEPNPQIIPIKEFNAVLNLIKKESAYKEIAGERKQMYWPWLKDAFRLGLYTGRRREEIVSLKWSNVKADDNGVPIFIESTDLKSDRIVNKDQTKKKKVVFIPVIGELKKLLYEMGYNENLGKDKYLIDSEESASRITIIDRMSKSFSYYYNLLGTGKNISFKHLRKTYMTYMQIFTGNAISISGHSDQAVLDQHYIDGSTIARNIAKKGGNFFDV